VTEYQPNPDAVRLSVRLADYSNREVERESISSTDRAVFDRVRAHEQALIEQVKAHRADAKVDEQAATELMDALRGEVRYALDRPIAGVDLQGLASRYKTLRALSEKAIEALEKAEAEEAFMQPKLADPYGDIVKLWEKWAILRPTL
jgi:hypothetical protein